MAQSALRRLLVLGLFTAVLVVGGVTSAWAQRNPEARADYLDARNMADQAEEVEELLLDRLEERDMGTAQQRERTADFFSFILTVSGVSVDTIERLDEKGIDIIHTITARSRPLIEQSILVDLVVVGTIADVTKRGALPDDHQHSLKVVVTDVLKGHAPADTILIRQKRRVSPQSPDRKPEVGETFLFLASNGVYRYYLHRNTTSETRPPEAEVRRRYSIYRRYRIKEGRLLWEGRNREETRRAFKSVRTLDRWVGAE